MDENLYINTDTEQTALPIGEVEIAEAEAIRKKYEQGKTDDDREIKEALDWYQQKQRDYMNESRAHEVQTGSAWTLNIIANKHADAMDNIPTANILPREESDKQEAKNLSDIIPAILEQNNFESVYDDASWYLYVTGTTAFGTFWDASKHNGLGDISIKRIDIRNLFYEPGKTDIQDSKNVFHVEMFDNDVLVARYPELEGKLTKGDLITQYQDDPTVDYTDKTAVVDWYYKKIDANGKSILHFCKYAAGVVLFATENDPQYAQRGWYDDGNYPFDISRVYPRPGRMTGRGLVSVCKTDQEYIDRMSEAILENALANTAPRYFSRDDGNINETEMLDYTKPIVHVEGSLDASIRPIDGKPLPNGAIEVMMQKIDEIKETSGTRDVATGGTTSGVTAASAIAAMQEAGSKLSRDIIASQYRTFKNMIVKVIERIRQFYDLPRCFRILGERGAMEFVTYTNAGIAARGQTDAFGVGMTYRIPEFDVSIVPEKKSPYKRVSQNELAIQLYQLGFMNPQMADQALVCIDMMDFDRKEELQEKIAQNGTLLQKFQAMAQTALQLAAQLDGLTGSQIAPQLAAQLQAEAGGAPIAGGAPVGFNENNGGESANTRAARQRVADSTTPA